MSSQLELGLTDRHAGQQANLAAGTTGYRDDRHRVEVAVATLARSGAEFTADSVHKLVKHDGGEDYDGNLVSSVLGIWAKDGRIARQSYAVSTRRSRHASRNTVWLGTRASWDDGTVPEPR